MSVAPPLRTREEAAHEEVGRTAVSRRQAVVLTAVFLAAIGVLAPLQAVVDLRHPDRDGPFILTLWTDAQAVLSMLQADEPPAVERPAGPVDRILAANARALESIDSFERLQKDAEHSLLTGRLITPVQSVLTGVLGAGNERAYPGRDGWAFFRDAVDHLTMPGFLEPRQLDRRAQSGSEWQAPPMPDPRPAILIFDQYLRERGIDLILMPVPVKASIYPDRLSARYEGIRNWLENPDLGKLVETVDRAGVRIYDAGEALYLARLSRIDSVFRRTDTHWAPPAVDLVARELATLLRNQGLVPDPLTPPYRRTEQEVTHLGDIAGTLLRLEDTGVFEPETVTIRPVASPDGDSWQPDPDAPILFLGDSFANIYSLPNLGWGAHAGLVEQLSYHLQMPVDRIAINDSGAYATREALASSLVTSDRLAGKKFVIWQFAARELSLGDWRHIDWKRIHVGAATPAAPTRAGGVPVEGVIAQITYPPQPGTVTYRDCITEIHLTDIEGDLRHDEVVVYALGMQDNQWTPVAQLRPGQRVTLHLTDWETARQQAGRDTMRHESLDDPDLELALLPEYWGEL